MSKKGTAGTRVKRLPPGATLGVIGGGQLGRYFVIKARQFGYNVWVLDPDANAPAMQLASVAVVAAYDDTEALNKMGAACDAVTIEFENVPASSLELLSSMTQLAPAAASVQLSQDRMAEKRHALDSGLSPVPHVAITTTEDISAATNVVSFPAILKTSRMGYDGKGQLTCNSTEEVMSAFEHFGSVACVLEQRINLAAEVSVILARGFDGDMAVFPVAQNVHRDGILFTSVVPSTQNEHITTKASEQACALAQAINHIGVLAVEFFVAEDGTLYFNEMAPRPHNSGHYTLDATLCSQFEQQLRVLCGQALGGTDLLSPVAMVNLLGDVWGTQAPQFDVTFNEAGCHLHLYGKAQARPGRKMGHINCLAADSKSAESMAHRQYAALL